MHIFQITTCSQKRVGPQQQIKTQTNKKLLESFTQVEN